MNSDYNSESSNFKLPLKEKISRAVAALSGKERRVFVVLAFVLTISSLTLLQMLNKSLMIAVPLRGGAISEGIVGTPRFVNPVLASSPADLDMVALVYSGLMRKTNSGTPVPGLALKYEMGKDGLTYTFTLRDDIYFHNGEPVTAEDVIFTINQVKNSVIKSPEKVNWDGIAVEKIDDRTIEFKLRQPNANFLQNAALGIMPKSLWEDDPIELNSLNTAPIGSGPYRIEGVGREASGIITSYELAAFEDFALGKPYVEKINFYFYPNETDMLGALLEGRVSQISSVSPRDAEMLKNKGYRIESEVMPRIFGLFFNQNKNQIFLDKTVTRAINDAIDKEKIVRDVLLGYGQAVNRPIPESLAGQNEELIASVKETRAETVTRVRENLKKAGWSQNEEGFFQKTITDKNKRKTSTVLEFSISTGNAPELAQTALLIQNDLREVGIKADIKTFEVGNLNQNVIRPREFDALLFGQIVNRESDLFAFWHSSQRKDPGQNVAMYTNARADKLLEDAFITVNDKSRREKYADVEAEILKDRPAVFLYSPNFIYVVSPALRGMELGRMASPANRFRAAHSWFVQTEDVWKIFAKIIKYNSAANGQ